jgi:hypothetical protein
MTTRSQGAWPPPLGRDGWALKGQAARQGFQPQDPALRSGVDHARRRG